MEKPNSGSLLVVPRGDFNASIEIFEGAGMQPWMLKLLRQEGGGEIARKVISVFWDIRIKEWQDFYKKYFNTYIDLSIVKIPEPKIGFERLMIVLPQLSVGKIFEVMNQRFQCHWHFNVGKTQWNKSKEAIFQYISPNQDPYAFWVRNGVEPDKKYIGKFNDDNTEINFPIETLSEALIHHLKYWDENEKHINARINLITYHDQYPGLISSNYRGLSLCISEFYGFVHSNVGPREKVI